MKTHNKRLKLLQNLQNKMLIPYIMAGEHDKQTTLNQLQSLAKYCSVIEVGIPFSNPVADGKIIQRSSIRSLKNKTKISDVFSIVDNFRKTNDKTAIVLMGYFNIVHKFGVENFAAKCKQSGVDGIIICDLPIEESTNIVKAFNDNQVDVIQLVTNLTDKVRMQQISQVASGFVYFVSVLGVTGSKEPNVSDISNAIQNLNSCFNLPKVVGFGIKTPQMADTMYKHFDGIVIGSHFIDFFDKNCFSKSDCYAIFESEIAKFVR